KVSQKATGKLEVPNWDQASQKKVRDALLALSATTPDFKRSFGKKGEVDPVRHLMGTAAGWGGNPDKDAIYLNITPEKNDGKTVYRVNVKDVPVDGFWSVSVYNAEGYFQRNAANAYTVNNITAQKNSDGSIPIQFGG
ncbi:MAG TPA: carboxylesterase, partial [Cupriavidus sp.]|nr:carboxylesterase [Cupriavidus sp.]